LGDIRRLISAFFVAWGMQRFAGWPWPSALVFAILIAATDPMAIIAMFKDTGMTGRLRLLVESESLLNDGVAALPECLFEHSHTLLVISRFGTIPVKPALLIDAFGYAAFTRISMILSAW